MVYWKNPGLQLLATIVVMAVLGALTIYLAGSFSNAFRIDDGNLAVLGTIILGVALAGVRIGIGALRNRRREGADA